MFWMLAAQVGMSAMQSALGGKSEAAAKNAELARRFEQTRLQNEEAARANQLNLTNLMYNSGMQDLQAGMAKQQNLRNRLSLGIAEKADQAEVSLNQAASGVVGASADAVLNDIQLKYNEANEELARQRQLEQFQHLSGKQQAYTEYWQNLSKIDMSGFGVQPAKTRMGNHFLGGMMNVGTSYLSRKIELKLGEKPSNNIQLESLKGRR